MQVEIRQLTNDDFPALVALNAEFYSTLPVKQDSFNATNNLVVDINTQHDFKAFGLFEDKKLIGFVTGYAFSKKSFYFSGLYVKIRIHRNLKQLIEHCFKVVEEAGYEAWEMDCTNANISKMMAKYGATPVYTRVKKNIGV